MLSTHQSQFKKTYFTKQNVWILELVNIEIIVTEDSAKNQAFIMEFHLSNS